jgi:hypothetical protein
MHTYASGFTHAKQLWKAKITARNSYQQQAQVMSFSYQCSRSNVGAPTEQRGQMPKNQKLVLQIEIIKYAL